MPFSSSTSESLRILDELFEGFDAREIPKEEDEMICKVHNSDSCYAGSHGISTTQMIKCIGFRSDDVFLDLGCGYEVFQLYF